MKCPLCKAAKEMAHPIEMFAGGLGLGILMGKHPGKVVNVCKKHREVFDVAAEAVGVSLNLADEEPAS
jgi:hypothetical protein